MSDTTNATFNCEVCGKTHVWEAAKAGQRVGCGCGVLMDVPEHAPGSAESSPAMPMSMSLSEMSGLGGANETNAAPSTGRPVRPASCHVDPLDDFAGRPAAQPTAVGAAVLGGLLGGVVGGLAWGLIAALTRYEIGWAAVGVGFFSGIGATVAARQGNQAIGAWAAFTAVVGLFIGKVLVLQWCIMPDVRDYLGSSYEAALAWRLAKDADRPDLTRHIEEQQAGFLVAAAHGPIGMVMAAERLDTPRELRHDMATLGEMVNERITNFTQAGGLDPDDPGYADAMKKALGKTGGDYTNAVVARLSISQRISMTLGLYDLLWLFLAIGAAYKTGRTATVLKA
jgi:hypothetical protein